MPGKDAVVTSGILQRYVETLVSKDYLAVLRSRRTRDPPSFNQGNLNGGLGVNPPTGTLAVHMAQNFSDLVRSYREFRIVVFEAIVEVIWSYNFLAFLRISPFTIDVMFELIWSLLIFSFESVYLDS